MIAFIKKILGNGEHFALQKESTKNWSHDQAM